MRISSRPRAIALAAAVLGGSLALAASCSRSRSGSGAAATGGNGGTDAQPETAAEARADSPVEDASDAADAWYPPCDPDPHTSLIPAGWVRFPGMPCQCTIWVAPSQGLMTPAPSWAQDPGGWLELDDPQSGDPGAVSPVLGSNYLGAQQIAYSRTVQRGTQENVVLDVGAGHYVYDERVVGDQHFNIPCYSKLEASAQGVTVHDSWVSSTATTTFGVLSSSAAASPLPIPFQKRVDDGYVVFGAGAKVVGGSDTDRFDAFTLDPIQAYHGAWTSDGRILDTAAPVGWDDALFFAVYGLDTSKQLVQQYLVWDAQRGVRPLLGSAPGATAPHSACGLGTDGKTLVWTELSNWDGQAWQTAKIMQAPFATDAAALKPVVVRDAPAMKKCVGRWIVGAGYAATAWAIEIAPKQIYQTFAVRLSDGAAWQIDVPGVQFFPLYLTDTEMAAGKQYDTPQDGGPDGYRTWRIVRYPLSLLGAPNLP